MSIDIILTCAYGRCFFDCACVENVLPAILADECFCMLQQWRRGDREGGVLRAWAAGHQAGTPARHRRQGRAAGAALYASAALECGCCMPQHASCNIVMFHYPVTARYLLPLNAAGPLSDGVVPSPDSKTHACSCFDMVTDAHCILFTPRAFHLPRPGEPAEAAHLHPQL